MTLLYLMYFPQPVNYQYYSSDFEKLMWVICKLAKFLDLKSS